MDWYAIFVETGKEEYFQKWLRFYFPESTLHSIVPKRILRERKQGKSYQIVRTFFPGYVLVQTDMDISIYLKVKSIPKFIRILGDGIYYSKIKENEMLPILKLLGNNDVLDFSTIYMENSQVIVKSGPLQGMEGIICKVDKRKSRAKILLNFLNSEKIIDVAIEVLEKVN